VRIYEVRFGKIIKIASGLWFLHVETHGRASNLFNKTRQTCFTKHVKPVS
ncbi:MAG: hypothetical protein JG782_843, partial [Anaerophaga sp.]|nr:hypothetical protein [Anaerophaga sp.]